MYSVDSQISDTIREKGSEFTGYLFRSDSKKRFEKRLLDIERSHSDATHICYAWRIDPFEINEYSQDAGEPNGTAGRPILNQLRSYDMINTGAVVTRYFGGKKLGKKGLIESYGSVTRRCLEKAKRQIVLPVIRFKIKYDYRSQKIVDKLMARYHLVEQDVKYLEYITLEIACPAKFANTFIRELEQVGYKLKNYRKIGRGVIMKTD